MKFLPTATDEIEKREALERRWQFIYNVFGLIVVGLGIAFAALLWEVAGSSDGCAPSTYWGYHADPGGC